MIPRVEALGVGPQVEIRRRSLQHRTETHSLDGGGRRNPDEIQDRGHQVEAANLPGHPEPASDLAVGRPDEKRDLHGGVVDEEAVGALAVAPQALAVVPDEREHGVVGQFVRVQPVEEASHQRVGERHFGVVVRPDVVARPGSPRLRRVVGPVRVVEVDPREETLLLHAVHPRERGV